MSATMATTVAFVKMVLGGKHNVVVLVVVKVNTFF
jgi:hypothetical protein